MIEVATPLLSLESVVPEGDYRLCLHFSDGTARTVDFGPFLTSSSHPEMRKYLESKRFLDYQLVEGDLMWGDYDLIFPIHKLYSGEI